MNRIAATLTACTLILSAGAYTPAFAQESPSETPRTQAELNATFAHPLGFTIRHPASWKMKVIDGTSALIPEDAPQLAGGPGEAYAFAAMEFPENLDLQSRMENEMSQAFPGMQLAAEPQRRGRSVTLRYRASEQGIAAVVRATATDRLLVIMVAIGETGALARHDALAAGLFESIRPSEPAVDSAIVGSWTHSSSYSSSGFSMASSKTYTLRADGTYTFSSQIAGGMADVGADTGRSQERGIWAARDGIVTLVDGEGTAISRTYRLVDGHLLTFDAAGKRTIWSR
jgi:hypothetical protein